MASLPKIHLIHASDASQHMDKINEIFQNLKAENRIGDFHSLNAVNDLSTLNEKSEDGDLMLILLSNQLEPQRVRIESKFNELRNIQPDIRIVEILVDNLRYDNRFITLPTDLKPIHSREDTDAAWKNIEQNLKDMLPVKKIERLAPLNTNWSKYLKIAGLLIVLIAVFFLFRGLFKDDTDRIVRPPSVEPGTIREVEAEEIKIIELEQEMMQEAEAEESRRIQDELEIIQEDMEN
jgi:hypothetical protein